MSGKNNVDAPGSTDVILQPVIVPVMETNTPRQVNYPGMMVTAIRTFASVSIIFGFTSIGIQIAALVIYVTSLSHYVVRETDVIGTGIWGGALYVVSGSLAIAASHKRTKSLLVWTALLSILSICASIAAATLSGIAAYNGVYKYCGYYYGSLCNDWIILEWSLMTVSIVATISSLLLFTLLSVALCCSKARDTSPASRYTYGHGQPIIFQKEPGLFQVAYIGHQQTQSVPVLLQQIPEAIPVAPAPVHCPKPSPDKNKNIKIQLEKKKEEPNEDIIVAVN